MFVSSLHKTRHCQGENVSIFIDIMYEKKVIKKEIVNLQNIKKISRKVEENMLKRFY